MKLLVIPIALELLGIATIGTGIGMELSRDADIWYVVITVGSLMVASGGIIWGKFVRVKR